MPEQHLFAACLQPCKVRLALACGLMDWCLLCATASFCDVACRSMQAVCKLPGNQGGQPTCR